MTQGAISRLLSTGPTVCLNAAFYDEMHRCQPEIRFVEKEDHRFRADLPGDACATAGILETRPLSAGWRLRRDLLREARNGKPLSAARWVGKFLMRTTVIVVLEAEEESDAARSAADLLRTALRTHFGGIWQIPGEGFTNETGAFILLSNPSGLSGRRLVATLQGEAWIEYVFDAGNPSFLRDFSSGVLPRNLRSERSM